MRIKLTDRTYDVNFARASLTSRFPHSAIKTRAFHFTSVRAGTPAAENARRLQLFATVWQKRDLHRKNRSSATFNRNPPNKTGYNSISRQTRICAVHLTNHLKYRQLPDCLENDSEIRSVINSRENPMKFKTFSLFACCIVVLSGSQLRSQENTATSHRNMVATVHPLATRAGLAALEAGGNAIDAAIAAGLTLGVVDGFNSGIGGGCFILIRTADGKLVALDGREMAPAAAHRDMYLRDGKPDTSASQIGPLAVGVPGALAAYSQAVEQHGNLPFEQLILPAATIADEGFVIGKGYAARVAGVAKHFRKFAGSAAVLLGPDGEALAPDHRLIQKDLANTYRRIAQHGTAHFYRGPFSKTVAKWMSENGGIITEQDFANYKTVLREPIESQYRDLQIYGFPPPSSGGVHVAQILNILENFDLKNLYQRDQATYLHVVAEAMKLGFADRAYWLGDPDHVNVPRGLIASDYSDGLAKKIDLAKSTPVYSHGQPPFATSDFFEKHTTHICAADSEGNWVAITTTVNTTFGSKVIVPGTGVILNNQMDDFSIAPGTPNAFGLIGNEANAIAAGKRPRSSMSPTIVVRDGRPVMCVGAAGGPRIITQVIQAIVGHFDLGRSVAESVASPRIHHQWSPDRLSVETSFDNDVARGLEEKGHEVVRTRTSGTMQAIVYDSQSGLFLGVSDPRVNGLAAGKQE